MTDSRLDAARDYAQRGWRVLPLHSVRDGICTCHKGAQCDQRPGKHPRTEHGVHDATTNLSQIDAWWQQWPDANIGIATGVASGIVAIDVDPRHGGTDSLSEIAELLPETLTVQTGSGGLHFYYRVAEPVKSRVVLPGIELKGDGAYVVAPPSNHLDGLYIWLDERPMRPLSIALLRGHRKEATGGIIVAPDQKEWVAELLNSPCPEGQRDNTLTRLAGYFRNVLPEAVTTAILLDWNERCCRPPLLEEQVRRNISHKYQRYPGSEQQATRIWTSRTLLAAQFPPPVWVVEDLLAEGLAFLSGRPKRGKSWLILQIAVDVSTGKSSIGPTQRGRVLYISLEESEELLQNRLKAMGAEPSDDLLLLCDLPALDQGGLVQLTDYIEAERPTLVVIDTLSRVMGRGRDQDSVGDMTDLLAPLQRLAISQHAAIVLIDHHRKPGAELSDMIDDILGSTAKAAVADSILGLYRKSGETTATLKVTGRRVQERELALTWDSLHFRWHLAGSAPSGQAAKQVTELIELLAEVGEADAQTISEYLKIQKSRAYELLDRACEDGLVRHRYVTGSTAGRPRRLYRLRAERSDNGRVE